MVWYGSNHTVFKYRSVKAGINLYLAKIAFHEPQVSSRPANFVMRNDVVVSGDLSIALSL